VSILTPLTARECDVLRLLALGMTDREIAGALVISMKTLKTHITRIYEKMGLGQGKGYNPRVMAALFVARGGLDDKGEVEHASK
jgi:DNA-binding NarL/FixJ family response regulator